jgi:hypothetical protein
VKPSIPEWSRAARAFQLGHLTNLQHLCCHATSSIQNARVPWPCGHGQQAARRERRDTRCRWFVRVGAIVWFGKHAVVRFGRTPSGMLRHGMPTPPYQTPYFFAAISQRPPPTHMPSPDSYCALTDAFVKWPQGQYVNKMILSSGFPPKNTWTGRFGCKCKWRGSKPMIKEQ